MQQIQHQTVFPVVPRPPAAPSVFGSMEMPVKATAVAAAVACAATFNLFAPPKPAAAAVVTLPTGFQTYDTPTKVVTFVGPELGQASFPPVFPQVGFGFTAIVVEAPFTILDFGSGTLFSPPAHTQLPTGFQTYDTPTKVNAFVGPEIGQAFKFIANPVIVQPPVVVQQTDWVPNFKTKVFPELSQAPAPLVVTPTGWQPYDNQRNFKTFVTDALPFVTPKPPLAVLLPAFYHDQEYAFAKPYPIAVHLEISPFIPPGINLPPPPVAPEATGDGPPWHDTPKELAHLKKYREELARLQRQFDKRHRENVEQAIRDVELAAYGEPELVERAESSILALPQLPKKSLFSVDLKSLKASVEQARAERELAEDEAEVQMILKEFFS